MREHYGEEFKPVQYPYDGLLEEEEFDPYEWSWPVPKEDDCYEGHVACFRLALDYGRKEDKVAPRVDDPQDKEEDKMHPFYEKETLYWMVKAAEKGYEVAMTQMALAHLNGWFGVPKDKDKALSYLMRSCGIEGTAVQQQPWDHPFFDTSDVSDDDE